MASAAPALKHDDADDARTKEKVMVKKRVRRTVCNKVWREDEKKALEAGVIKYGKGAWAKILNDPDLRDALSGRTNVDLKVRSPRLSCMNFLPVCRLRLCAVFGSSRLMNRRASQCLYESGTYLVT